MTWLKCKILQLSILNSRKYIEVEATKQHLAIQWIYLMMFYNLSLEWIEIVKQSNVTLHRFNTYIFAIVLVNLFAFKGLSARSLPRQEPKHAFNKALEAMGVFFPHFSKLVFSWTNIYEMNKILNQRSAVAQSIRLRRTCFLQIYCAWLVGKFILGLQLSNLRKGGLVNI